MLKIYIFMYMYIHIFSWIKHSCFLLCILMLSFNFLSFLYKKETSVKSFVICLIFPKWMFFIFLNILPRIFYDSRHENGISNVELTDFSWGVLYLSYLYVVSIYDFNTMLTEQSAYYHIFGRSRLGSQE